MIAEQGHKMPYEYYGSLPTGLSCLFPVSDEGIGIMAKTYYTGYKKYVHCKSFFLQTYTIFYPISLDFNIDIKG